MKHKVKNDNEYGSARFSTDNEIKKNFKKEKVSNIKEAGFPVSFSKDLKTIYFDRETPHYVYLGSTGSGKSVTAVIPTCTFISRCTLTGVFLWKNLGGFMLGKILGIIFLILIGIFSLCSCKVASWADQEIEEDLRKREQNEKKDI